MPECNHDCSSCGENCPSREQESLLAPLNGQSSVKKVIGIVSGKGGVGKSMVTSLLAVLAGRAGLKTGILDADITGPSIPKAFHVHERAMASEEGIYPSVTKTGIRLMSVNLLLDAETDPVLWRGPILAGVVKQFWTDVIWGDLDVLFIDMPPGTGDVPLTVFQSIPLDGVLIVTSPQDLVSMIVGKAVKMAEMMNIPVLGLIENYSYYQCPDCGKKHEIYGPSRAEETAAQFGIPVAARLPVAPKLAAAADEGMIELFEGDWLDGLFRTILPDGTV